MKTISACIAALLFAVTAAFATLPQTISYQGYVKDANSGVPLNSNAVSMKFSLYSSTRQGSGAIWSETQSPVSVANGIFSAQLGSVTPISASFDVSYWLGVNINNSGELPLHPLSSVPYAQRAAAADTVGGNATLSGQTLAQLDNRYSPLPFSNTSSAARIATQRWNQPVQFNGKYTVGSGSIAAIAFDGTHIWVTNTADNTVTKIRAIDSVTIGTYHTGSGPCALVFDGANMWVANSLSGNVSKIRASDGVTLGTFSTGANPSGIAFDGSKIWVANSSGFGSVSVINATDGLNQTTLGVDPFPQAVAFDGSYIWVVCLNGHVFRYQASNTLNSTNFFVGSGAQAIVFDGTSIWISDQSQGGNLTKFSASSGNLIGTFNLKTMGSSVNPRVMTFDGNYIWIADSTSVASVIKIRAGDGANIGTYYLGGSNPTGIAFDGINVWVSIAGVNNSVTRIPAMASTGYISGSGSYANGSVGIAAIAPGAITNDKIAGPIPASLLDLTTVAANGLAVGTNQLVVSAISGGKVGIGTATPTASLEVVGNIKASGTLTAGTIGIGTQTPNRTLHLAHNGGVEMSLLVNDGLPDWRTWNLWTSGGAGVKQNLNFRLLNDAGTATILDVFHLNSDGSAWLNGVLTSGGLAATISSGTAVSGTSDSSIGVQGMSTNSVGLVGISTNNTGIWGQANNGTAVDGMSNSGTGVLGRSTSGNGVRGTTGGNIAVYAINNSTDAPSIEGWNQGSGYIYKGWSGASPALKFWVANSGNAWIAGTLTQASDLRLKNDIQPLEDTLNKVLRLRGVSYVMKADESKVRKIGVIAQELEQEYPELVASDDQGMKSVAYANLTAVLIEGVKALKAENDAQKSEIENLKTRLDRFEMLLSGK